MSNLAFEILPGGGEKCRPNALAITMNEFCFVFEEQRHNLDRLRSAIRIALLHVLVHAQYRTIIYG